MKRIAVLTTLAIMLSFPCLAKDLTYTDVPDPLVDEINDRVMTILVRYEKDNADIVDPSKREALNTRIASIRERIKPTPIVVEPEPVEPVVEPDPIEPTVNWSDTERIR